MKYILLLILLSACTGPISVSPEIYGASKHTRGSTPAGKKYNEFNPGVGIHVTNGGNAGFRYGARGAYYKNSINRGSSYLAGTAEYCIGDKWHACGGAMAGAVTGYGGVKPLVAPTAEFGYGCASVVVTAFPTQDRQAAAVAGWLKFKLMEW